MERKPRRVQIRELEILEMSLPTIRFRVVCSKGTYIRTLCHDIGEKLDCGGAMAALERSRVGIFGIEEALTLAQIERLRDEDKLTSVIIPPDGVFGQYQAVKVTSDGKRLLENGNRIPVRMLSENVSLQEAEQVRMYDEEGRFYGIYQYLSKPGEVRPVKMFL